MTWSPFSGSTLLVNVCLCGMLTLVLVCLGADSECECNWAEPSQQAGCLRTFARARHACALRQHAWSSRRRPRHDEQGRPDAARSLDQQESVLF